MRRQYQCENDLTNSEKGTEYLAYTHHKPCFNEKLENHHRHFCSALQERKKDTLNPTLNRLNTHELVYDEVHLKNDKSILFENSYAIIDDSPALLGKAEQLGKVRTGLSYPWNKESGHPLFRNLKEVYCYIKNGSL